LDGHQVLSVSEKFSAVVSTDELVPESVPAQLRENPAVEFARAVELAG
jgi:hypothetical protein